MPYTVFPSNGAPSLYSSLIWRNSVVHSSVSLKWDGR